MVQKSAMNYLESQVRFEEGHTVTTPSSLIVRSICRDKARLMTPPFIRWKPSSQVTLSRELTEFMESCKDDRLKERVESAFTELKGHYESGKKIPKYLWPRYYTTKWGITNLYVKKLGPDWRLTYTLVSGAAGIEAFCLEILSHREYDQRFGYATS